ncbi:MAG TPA: VOC family protein [Pseudolabrys sp.]
MTGRATRLLRIGLNVADLARGEAFYRDALGFATVTEHDAEPDWAQLLASDRAHVNSARLRLGEQALELTAFDPPGARYPTDSTAADLWFQHFAVVTNDMPTACRRLEQYGATPITQDGPQRLPPAAGSVVAYKFRDPDGHPLELIHFPPGIGDAAWHAAIPGPTIGIDHSALSIAGTKRSLAFYRALGLDILSRQVNSGPEQDCLDGLSHAVVDVIALAPVGAQTPHVELLHYRSPRGRPFDPNRQPHDIADSRLIFQVEDLPGLIAALAAVGAVASPMMPIPPRSRAASVRDPTGHAVVLLEYS